MNKLERKLLMEASFFDRMYADVIRALFRPAAKKFFEKIANDIDTKPEVAKMFQDLVDAKKKYKDAREAFEKMSPAAKGKLD
jgi:hypothetical protein